MNSILLAYFVHAHLKEKTVVLYHSQHSFTHLTPEIIRRLILDALKCRLIINLNNDTNIRKLFIGTNCFELEAYGLYLTRDPFKEACTLSEDE